MSRVGKSPVSRSCCRRSNREGDTCARLPDRQEETTFEALARVLHAVIVGADILANADWISSTLFVRTFEIRNNHAHGR